MPRAVATASFIVAFLGVGLGARPQVETSLGRLAAYVGAWERDLGSVMADERYEQTVARQPRSELSR
jgi:hypothetical protein